MTVLKTIGLYAFALFLFRVMGQRTLGDMQAFDFVVVIAVAEILGAPLADPRLDARPALLAIVTLVALQLVLAWLCLRSPLLRWLLEGRPVLVVWRGRLIERNLNRAKVSREELAERLREKGIARLDEVYRAYLETDGNLSVLKKRADRPATLADLRGLGLIQDGKIHRENLGRARMDLDRLKALLQRQGIKRMIDVETAVLGPGGRLEVKKKKRAAKSGGRKGKRKGATGH
ncbi:MAG TPA: DUF421 domain-containing protein [Bacillota bacterium]